MSDDPICTNETIIKTEPQIRIKMELPDDITSGDNSLASSSSNFPILGTDEAPIKVRIIFFLGIVVKYTFLVYYF